MTHKDASILIVYNADSGILNAVMHALHKAIKPETYACSLCALTYGAVSMHGDWKRFLSAIPLPIVFHHRDDFAADYPNVQAALPAVLIRQGDAEPENLITAAELDALTERDGLMGLLKKRLIERFGAGILVDEARPAA